MTDTTKLMKVAKAIYDADPAGNCHSFDEWIGEGLAMAEAAVEAMREPTTGMVEVGLGAPRGFPSVEARKAAEYTAMIDYVLAGGI